MGSRAKSVLLLLLFSCLLVQAGCISPGPPPDDRAGGDIRHTPVNTQPEAAFTGGILPGDAPGVSLSTALAGLPAAEQEGLIKTRGLNLTMVWGYGVDSGGLARTWVLGMKGGERTTILSYSGGDYRELELPTSLPEGDLKMGELRAPEEIFRENMNTIVKEMNNLRVGECDLALEADTYQVIIHSASESTTLSFSAKKGDMTPRQTPAAPAPVHSPGSRLALHVLVPLGAAALAILGFRSRS